MCEEWDMLENDHLDCHWNSTETFIEEMCLIFFSKWYVTFQEGGIHYRET